MVELTTLPCKLLKFNISLVIESMFDNTNITYTAATINMQNSVCMCKCIRYETFRVLNIK